MHPPSHTALPGGAPDQTDGLPILMTASQAAAALLYPSTAALRMACIRGVVPLTRVRIPGKRGSFFYQSEVQATLNAWLTGKKEGPM